MDRSEVWSAIDDQRRAVVGLLESLSEEGWDRPSLCEGWTVRRVAAHPALQNITWSMIARALPDMVRHGGMNGAIRVMACRHAERPVRSSSGRSAAGSGCGGHCRASPSARRPSTTWCMPRTLPCRSGALPTSVRVKS
jgi:mycothiol maleylpyruvate isomerase-like protein